MKKIFLIIFLFFFFNTVIPASAKVKNRIVVKVDNEIITTYEVKNKILSSLILANEEINQLNINKIKSQILDVLIQNKLKTIELSKHSIKVDQTKINNYLNEISSGDLTGFKAKFKNNNVDFKIFLGEVKTEIAWNQLIYELYSNKIDIDESSINADLEKIFTSNLNFKEFNLSEIEILSDINNKNKISAIKELIENDGFEKTATTASISSTASKKGNLGWVNSGTLSKEIFIIIDKMKPGDISIPISRPSSILFLKLNEIRNTKNTEINIEEIKKNLINQKKNNLFNLYSRSHLSKLKNTKLISYK